MNPPRPRMRRLSAVVGIALCVVPPWSSAAGPFDQAQAITDARLDTLRGGFDAGGGVMVSFGIQRAVEVNGQLITKTNFNIPDLARITPEQAQRAGAALAASNLVRNGVSQIPSAQGTGGIFVIQNSLDNQVIRSTTTLNVSTTSLGMVQALNSLATLRDALVSSLPRP